MIAPQSARIEEPPSTSKTPNARKAASGGGSPVTASETDRPQTTPEEQQEEGQHDDDRAAPASRIGAVWAPWPVSAAIKPATAKAHFISPRKTTAGL
jgi:hypothetical protein